MVLSAFACREEAPTLAEPKGSSLALTVDGKPAPPLRLVGESSVELSAALKERGLESALRVTVRAQGNRVFYVVGPEARYSARLLSTGDGGVGIEVFPPTGRATLYKADRLTRIEVETKARKEVSLEVRAGERVRRVSTEDLKSIPTVPWKAGKAKSPKRGWHLRDLVKQAFPRSIASATLHGQGEPVRVEASELGAATIIVRMDDDGARAKKVGADGKSEWRVKELRRVTLEFADQAR